MFNKTLLIIIIITIILIIYFLKSDSIKGTDTINKLYTLFLNDTPEYYEINYEWATNLKKNYKIIYKEYLDYIKENNLVSYGKLVNNQEAIDVSNIPWPVIFLRVYNNNTNKIKYFPKTYELINSIPECTLAMFSILPPNKIIPTHSGPYKGVLRYHLALKTPTNTENCFIVVNNKKYNWKEGTDVLFDDTYSHRVENNTDEYRVILFLDIKRNFNNIILDTINRIILNLLQFSDTVSDIVTNVNEKS